MRFALSLCGCLLLLVVSVGAGFLFIDLHKLLGNLNGDVVNFSATLQRTNDALEAINRPCGEGSPCGLIANANKAIVKAGDAIVTTQMQERAIVPHTVKAMDQLGLAANSLAKTSDAATESALELTASLKTTDDTVKQVQPVLGQFRQDADDLDALLKDEAIHRTLDGAADLTQNANEILADTRRVADKISEDYLAPKPWWRKALPNIGDFWDIAAAAARSLP